MNGGRPAGRHHPLGAGGRNRRAAPLLFPDAAGCTHEFLIWLVGQRLPYPVALTLPDGVAASLERSHPRAARRPTTLATRSATAPIRHQHRPRSARRPRTTSPLPGPPRGPHPQLQRHRLTNLPLHDFIQNQIWCAIVALAVELTACRCSPSLVTTRAAGYPKACGYGCSPSQFDSPSNDTCTCPRTHPAPGCSPRSQPCRPSPVPAHQRQLVPTTPAHTGPWNRRTGRASDGSSPSMQNHPWHSMATPRSSTPSVVRRIWASRIWDLILGEDSRQSRSLRCANAKASTSIVGAG
jgi:hypothetical protein